MYSTSKESHYTRKLGRKDVVVGLQWGDEGKGKLIDWLSKNQRYDVVARFNGGANAGHTVVVGDQTYKLRLLPSGIVSGKHAFLGSGMVLDLEQLNEEIKPFDKSATISFGKNAHIVLPIYKQMDSEKNAHIGTTKNGIGIAYELKANRSGIRLQDIWSNDLNSKLERLNSTLLERGYELNTTKVRQYLESYGLWMRPHTFEDSPFLKDKVQNGGNILIEGAQGLMLSLDWGTYPYVTSSDMSAPSAYASLGLTKSDSDQVFGVTKAYITRVGGGILPTELHLSNKYSDLTSDTVSAIDLLTLDPSDETTALKLVKDGKEFGTVTKRLRRVGWLDLPQLKYAIKLNDVSGVAITKVDVLSGLDEVSLATKYKFNDGSEYMGDDTKGYPSVSKFEDGFNLEYKTFSGWDDISSDWDKTKTYLDFIQDYIGIPIVLVSYGPKRSQTMTFPEGI